MVRRKNTAKANLNSQKHTFIPSYSSDNISPVWMFDRIDRDGKFAFDVNRSDFQHKLFLEKMLEYSSMTWQEIKQQTHDRGKSKNNFIDPSEMCKEAQEKIRLKYNEYSDSVFSFAFTNRIRVFGIRENERFHVIWYDPNHEICPSQK